MSVGFTKTLGSAGSSYSLEQACICMLRMPECVTFINL